MSSYLNVFSISEKNIFPISHKKLNLIVAPQQNDFLRARDFIDRQIIPLIIILLNTSLTNCWLFCYLLEFAFKNVLPENTWNKFLQSRSGRDTIITLKYSNQLEQIIKVGICLEMTEMIKKWKNKKGIELHFANFILILGIRTLCYRLF